MTSVFENIKKDICKELISTESFAELEKKMCEILNEWELSEENQYYR